MAEITLENWKPLRGTVGTLLDDAASKWPDLVGWVFQDREVTIGEMKSSADRIAGGLLELGVGRGDFIALWTPNLFEWAATAFACYRIGSVVVPMNTRFKSGEARHVLEHSEAKVLVTQPRFLNIDFDDLLEEIAPDIQVTEGEVRSDSLPHLEHLITIGDSRLDALPWDSALLQADPPDTHALEGENDGSAPVLLQYTSGTTSLPKGALLPHIHIKNYYVEINLRSGLRPGEAFLSTQPFYHVGGSGALILPLVMGVTMVTPLFYEPVAVLRLIERYRCVIRGSIPTMFLTEMALPDFGDYDISSLRVAWCGGPPALLERIRAAFDIELLQLYGATEGGGTSGSIAEPWEERRISSGKAFAGTEVKIFDGDTRREMPDGEIGQIWMRGWDQMLGYYKDPERTAEAFKEDGWMYIGDLGRLDAAGNLYFTGREKDMIRVGGENTSAEEVEAMLLAHPEISQASVISVPDERMGEVPFAFVEVSKGSDLSEEDVIVFAKARVASFRVPRHVRMIDDWPLTGSNKIAKGRLRELIEHEFSDLTDHTPAGDG